MVRDDLLLLAEGDRVPADVVLLTATNLPVDESLLTGESVPVRKVAADGPCPMAAPGGDDLPFVYSGILAVHGHGLARVERIGPGTALGKIGRALEALDREATPPQRETGRVVHVFAVIGLLLSILVSVVYALSRGRWFEGALARLTLTLNQLSVAMLFTAGEYYDLRAPSRLSRRVSAGRPAGHGP